MSRHVQQCIFSLLTLASMPMIACGGLAVRNVGEEGMCGDNQQSVGEGCDDGNSLSGDGCSSTCQVEAFFDCRDGRDDCQTRTAKYVLGAPTTKFQVDGGFRGHGFEAENDRTLIDFRVHLALAEACQLDFFVWEPQLTAEGGALQLLTSNSMEVAEGDAFYSAGFPPLSLKEGKSYVLGIGWNCLASHYYDSTGDSRKQSTGVGPTLTVHWDNEYPGFAQSYRPRSFDFGETMNHWELVYLE